MQGKGEWGLGKGRGKLEYLPNTIIREKFGQRGLFCALISLSPSLYPSPYLLKLPWGAKHENLLLSKQKTYKLSKCTISTTWRRLTFYLLATAFSSAMFSVRDWVHPAIAIASVLPSQIHICWGILQRESLVGQMRREMRSNHYWCAAITAPYSQCGLVLFRPVIASKSWEIVHYGTKQLQDFWESDIRWRMVRATKEFAPAIWLSRGYCKLCGALRQWRALCILNGLWADLPTTLHFLT